MLVQGATGGMATALIQLGRAAGGQDALADVRDKVERVAQVAFDRLARSIDHAWAAWHKTITSDRYDDEVEPSARKRAKLGNPRWACHAFARNFIIPIFLNSPAQPIIADTACAIVITATR